MQQCIREMSIASREVICMMKKGLKSSSFDFILYHIKQLPNGFFNIPKVTASQLYVLHFQ